MRIHHLYIRKRRWVKGVTYEYRQLINSWLIEYYKEYYEGETFNDEYSDLIKDGLDINTAQGLIEILLEYGNVFMKARGTYGTATAIQ